MPIARREKSTSYVPLGILAEVTVPEKEYARAVATPESQPHAPGPEWPLRSRISRSAEQIDGQVNGPGSHPAQYARLLRPTSR
jgi:hypothetical protein